MHENALLQDLTMVFLVAGIVTIVFNRFRQPVVLGYIIAGLIVGPHTPAFSLVQNETTIRTLSELGIVFLLFAMGMEFSFGKLKKVGKPALLAAVIEIAFMMTLGFLVGKSFGWRFMDSIFLGGVLTISSTTIIVKTLRDLKSTREEFAQIIFGILVVEDLLAVLLLALLSTVASTGTVNPMFVMGTLWRLGMFLVVLYVGGILAVPRFLAYVSKFRNAEMLLVISLAICCGAAYLASVLQFSVALGSFLAGAVIAECREVRQIEGLTASVRDLFGAVFFVSVGMMMKPAVIWEHRLVIGFVTLAVIVGKVVSCSLGAFLFGTERRLAAKVGMGLAQIGEFSFIIAALGESKGVTSGFLYPVAVAVSALTTFTTPYLIRGSDRFVGVLERFVPSSFLKILDDYTSRASARSRRGSLFDDVYIRRGLIQIVLNFLLLSAIFGASLWLSVVGLAKHVPLPLAWALTGPVIWLCAMLISLPGQIGLVRRLLKTARAVGRHARAGASGRTGLGGSVEALLSGMGLFFIVALNLVFGLALLPPTETLLVAMALVLVVAILAWRKGLGLYKWLQASFESTLTESTPGAGSTPVTSLGEMPAEAGVHLILLDSASVAVGRYIKDTELRKATGASIVCIEREGANIVNPSPHEVLLEGDKLFLFGRPEQIEAAASWLTQTQPRP